METAEHGPCPGACAHTGWGLTHVEWRWACRRPPRMTSLTVLPPSSCSLGFGQGLEGTLLTTFNRGPGCAGPCRRLFLSRKGNTGAEAGAGKRPSSGARHRPAN